MFDNDDDDSDDDDDENSLIQREQRGRDEQLWDYLEATQHVCCFLIISFNLDFLKLNSNLYFPLNLNLYLYFISKRESSAIRPDS